MESNKKNLLKLWQNIFNQVYETSSYVELFACTYLCKSRNYLDEKTAKRNLKILNKHKGFFVPLEQGIAYAVVLSLTKLFEGKKQFSLQYLVSEATKFKIDRNNAYNKLKEKHQKTLKKLKTARSNFFAHRHKEFEKIDIPSRDAIFSLLNDVAIFLNSIGSHFGHSFVWKEGFAEDTSRDFQLVMNNLYRGESARIAEIEVKYSDKL